jgi:nucleoside-diphosphate-sugar epimerase
MTRIAVTGGSGKLGRAVVRDLAEHGYDVVNLDRVPPAPDAPGDFVTVDLADYGQVVQGLSRIEDRYDAVDGVVHLAAIPAPGLLPNTTTFVANITVTHHVFAAARAVGITNVVWASSETVLGLPFDTPPPYLPVDEGYHPRPESSYSLVKTLEEEMAWQLCRWDPALKMTGLRFSNVMDPDDYAEFPSFDADPALRRWNLFGYIDARDGAQACRLALERDGTGRDVFVIANADTVMSTPTADLVERLFPDVEVRGELRGTTTLLSIDKARRVLGYEPRHSWRDEVLPDGGA